MFWKSLIYSIKKDFLIICIAFVTLLTASIVFIGLYIANHDISLWSDVIDPLITIITVSTALLVYYNNSKTDWENNLEKRLTVHFELDEKYIMTCHEAYLSNESDIRAWGQTIGSQMTKKTSLDFYPFITHHKYKILYDEIAKEYYKLFEVTFHFINIADQIKEDKQPNLKTKYLVWWDNNDKSHGNKEVWFDEQPTSPKSIEEAISEYEKQNSNS